MDPRLTALYDALNVGALYDARLAAHRDGTLAECDAADAAYAVAARAFDRAVITLLAKGK
jgi:hypothetical protein